MSAQQIRVLTVDDHPLLREGITDAIMAQARGMLLVALPATAEQPILGEGRRDRLSFAHLSSGSDVASSARARG